jgi:threonine aldolase
MIDLRSDTVTQPTQAMRQAMAEADVGDDVLGDDPTVQALERRTAEILGKPAAVYMPSGTMTNQVALRCHTEPGDEILLPDNAHVYWYEAGAPGGISGLMCRMLPTRRGVFQAGDVEDALRGHNFHFAPTRVVCVENTSNRGAGKVWPIETVEQVTGTARKRGLATHMDGARLWNAIAATGVPADRWAEGFDTVSVCFSKGLGAPVGSALAGSEEIINRARRFRKMLGGGMRQAGIIAAGALHALEHHRDRLVEDHSNARRLAEGIVGLDGVELDATGVETNIVIFRISTMPAEKLVSALALKDVHVLATGPDTIRAVTSLMVSSEQIDQAVHVMGQICGATV